MALVKPLTLERSERRSTRSWAGRAAPMVQLAFSNKTRNRGAAAEATQSLSPAEVALSYHAHKHSLERYAPARNARLDMQPNPFREFAGCARTPLP